MDEEFKEMFHFGCGVIGILLILAFSISIIFGIPIAIITWAIKAIIGA